MLKTQGDKALIMCVFSGFKAVVVFSIMLLSINLALADENIGVVQQDGVLHVNAVEADRLLKKRPEIVVLDVRTPVEFKQGHIKSAVNLNYYDAEYKKLLGKLGRAKTYLVHCKSGRRSGLSIPILKSLGFNNIVHMDHGFDSWRRAGLDVSTD